MENNIRPTKKIQLPFEEHGVKPEVVIYEYATGGDYRIVQNQLVKFAKISQNGNTDFDMSGGTYSDIEDTYIERLIISLNGDNQNILDNVKDLKMENYQFIIAELNKLVTPEEVKKK